MQLPRGGDWFARIASMWSLSACGQGTSESSLPLEEQLRGVLRERGLALVFRLGTAATSPGFDTCRSSLRPWRASVQEIFCKAANVAVMIVERRKELLVCGQVPFGEPLQMASK